LVLNYWCACRVEADEHQNLATKLFQQAKELGIEAKGIQREQFIKEYGEADGPPAVSPKALHLLKDEAVRCRSTVIFSNSFQLTLFFTGLLNSCGRMLLRFETPRLLVNNNMHIESRAAIFDMSKEPMLNCVPLFPLSLLRLRISEQPCCLQDVGSKYFRPVLHRSHLPASLHARLSSRNT
jgi:hypothetical protein